MEINTSPKRFGKSWEMMNQVAERIIKGERVGIAGINSPDRTVKALRERGLSVGYEKMEHTTNDKFIYNWQGEIIDIERGQTNLVGYVFYKKH